MCSPDDNSLSSSSVRVGRVCEVGLEEGSNPKHPLIEGMYSYQDRTWIHEQNILLERNLNKEYEMQSICYSTDKGTMGRVLAKKVLHKSREQKKDRELFKLAVHNRSLVGKG